MSAALADPVHDIRGYVLNKMKNLAKRKKHSEGKSSSIPVDVLETPTAYVFYMDVPGLSNSDIQSNNDGKRIKREEEEEGEGGKYMVMERNQLQQKKVMRKFGLPNDANVSAITAKCEDGVLTVIMEKLPPSPKPMTIEVAIS